MNGIRNTSTSQDFLKALQKRLPAIISRVASVAAIATQFAEYVPPWAVFPGPIFIMISSLPPIAATGNPFPIALA